MFTLLIPFLACLAGIQAAEAGQDFKEPVTVEFYLRDWEHTANHYGWRDWSTYESPEFKELATIPDAVGDMVGSLVFKHANGTDSSRVITWIKDKSDKNLRQCFVGLSEDPKTSVITVELSPDSVKESVGEYEGFHLDCGEEIQSAAGGYPVQTTAASSSVFTAPTESAGITSTPAELAAEAYITSRPRFKPFLLVNFMAAPANLADPAEGGWEDLTDYNQKGFDESAGLLDDNDKKPPSMPVNNEFQTLLGQIKFESSSDFARNYSWMPKLHDDVKPFRNCSLTIKSDPHVSEIWVWADRGKVGKVDAMENGVPASEEILKEYKPEAIVATCD